MSQYPEINLQQSSNRAAKVGYRQCSPPKIWQLFSGVGEFFLLASDVPGLADGPLAAIQQPA
jgi:hypothetical protein